MKKDESVQSSPLALVFRKILLSLGVLASAIGILIAALLILAIFFLIINIIIFKFTGFNWLATSFYQQLVDGDTLIGTIFNLFATAIPIIIIYLLFHKKETEIIPFEKENLKEKYGKGFLAGGLAFSLVWIIAVLLGLYQVKWIFEVKNLLPLLALLMGYLIQGMSEEVICRGFVQTKISKIASPAWGLIVSSLFFATLHLGNSGINVLAFVDLILFALAMGLIFQRTKSLWFIGAYHSAWNFFQGPILGIKVSGNNPTAMLFQSTNKSSIDWLSGGAFGLEASIIAILIDLALVFYIYRLGQKSSFWLDN